MHKATRGKKGGSAGARRSVRNTRPSVRLVETDAGVSRPAIEEMAELNRQNELLRQQLQQSVSLPATSSSPQQSSSLSPLPSSSSAAFPSALHPPLPQQSGSTLLPAPPVVFTPQQSASVQPPLPSDITIKFMHADYKDNHPGIDKCEYETYRKTVSDLNISFTKLGEEECEKCTAHEEHLQTPGHHGEGGGGLVEDGNAPGECDVCREWREHKDRAKASREMYQDNSKQEWPAECCVRSVDLQKVIMLPRMPGNKTAIFTKRIVAFHETFATVGKKAKGKGKENTTSVVWHEGVAGRKAEEIASAFVSALEKDRDRKHVILWLDNCTAQNKNWCLITTLVGLVNSDAVEFEDITLKFFETGHTFTSADSFHHGVELKMKKRKGGNVYDFPEFVDVVKKSNSGKVDVIVLDNEKVRAYKGGQSQVKLKKAKVLLGKMCVIQLRRG